MMARPREAPPPEPSRLERVLPSGVQGRLALLIGLTLAALLLLLGGAYYQRHQEERVRILESETEVAVGVAATFDAYVRDIHRQNAALGKAMLAVNDKPRAVADRLLANSAALYASVYAFHWLSPSGQIVASSDPAAVGINLVGRAYFQQIRRGQNEVVSDLLPAGLTRSTISFVVATASRDEHGEIEGVIAASVDPTRLGRVALPVQRMENRPYAVFDRNGALVYRNPEADWTWQERVSWKDADPLLQKVLAEGKATAGEVSYPRSNESFFSARVPTGFGWVAGTGRPVRSATLAIEQALLRDIAVSAWIVLGAFLLAAYIGRSIARPLAWLEKAALAFGQGDLVHRAPVIGPREVKEVAARFNLMADELAAYQASLEVLVRERTRELEASNKELESFSYAVAHDLRSPLRAQEGFSRYLLQHYADRLDPRGGDYLHRINNAALRMGRLIDDLLNMAQVARTQMKIENVDLSALAREALAGLEKDSPERNVEADIAPGLTVKADRELLKLAARHLLDNALKSTRSRKRAVIRVGATLTGDAKTFFVSDNGVGFDMAYADKLFQPFHRLEVDHQSLSTGMGLTITQRIVARHGGRIWAASEPGEGATFYFTLGETP